jgi:hypothetical protein
MMKMNDITFTYPGAEKAQLNSVSALVSLSPLFALVGVNSRQVDHGQAADW